MARREERPARAFRPRKRFGQHFLAESWAAKVVEAIGVQRFYGWSDMRCIPRTIGTDELLVVGKAAANSVPGDVCQHVLDLLVIIHAPRNGPHQIQRRRLNLTGAERLLEHSLRIARK